MTPFVPEITPEDKIITARASLIESVQPLLDQRKYNVARGVIEILEKMDLITKGAFAVSQVMSPLDSRFTPAEVDYIRSGLRIDAIKSVRQRTGYGLKEAKDLVESFVIENYGATHT